MDARPIIQTNFQIISHFGTHWAGWTSLDPLGVGCYGVCHTDDVLVI